MRLAVFLRWPRRKSSRTAAKLPPLRIRINNRRNGFLEFFKPLADVVALRNRRNPDSFGPRRESSAWSFCPETGSSGSDGSRAQGQQ